jgi:hypothetical protein
VAVLTPGPVDRVGEQVRFGFGSQRLTGLRRVGAAGRAVRGIVPEAMTRYPCDAISSKWLRELVPSELHLPLPTHGWAVCTNAPVR